MRAIAKTIVAALLLCSCEPTPAKKQEWQQRRRKEIDDRIEGCRDRCFPYGFSVVLEYLDDYCRCWGRPIDSCDDGPVNEGPVPSGKTVKDY